ncbi:MAG TPA: nickel-dependent hydrogenase large subunit [Candidatus Cryosericum sp.]|nr:nickel-dependent hydrogenase large subunit [Candidatus Cryosericum sp.]
MSERNDHKVVLPIGPQHPSLKEPGSFKITLDGEKVERAVVEIGYNHRGIEKACESRNYIQDLYIIERVCGICSHAHTSCFCQAFEDMAGLEVPRRAYYIRGIVGELERLHSHLLWLGVAAHEIGFDTLFMYTWRDRELVLDMLAQIGGNRINYGVNTFGGVRRDLEPELMQNILHVCDLLEEKIKYYAELALTETTLIARLKGIGVLTADDVAHFSAVGPVARAAGILDDIRVVEPYGVYKEVAVNPITDDHCDVYGRTLVRVKEMLESIRLIRVMIREIPEGPISVRPPRKLPVGETLRRVEAPRGENIHYIRSNGSDMPDRVRVRAPSEANWHGMSYMLEGFQLADVPIIIAAIDPCYSCTDRAISLIDGAGSQLASWEQVRQFGIEQYKKLGVDPGSIRIRQF